MKRKKILLILVFLILLIAISLFLIFSKNEKNSVNKNTTQKEQMTLNGEKISFKKYRINKKFSIKVPEVFVEMSDEEVNKRYTNDFKPGLIFTNDEMNVNLLVHALNDPLEEDTINVFLENYKTTLNGANIIKEEVVTTDDKKHIAKLDYILQKDNIQESHHVRFFAMDGKAIMLDFKYPSDMSKDWDSISTYTLGTLEF